MSFKILVIDDDLFVGKIVTLCLAPVGEFAIHAVFDGPRGLEAAEGELPDLILLDFDLPHLDGLDVLRELRLQPALTGVPVIAITGALADHPRCAELVAESDAYLPKPLDFRVLRRTVQQLLRLPAASTA